MFLVYLLYTNIDIDKIKVLDSYLVTQITDCKKIWTVPAQTKMVCGGWVPVAQLGERLAEDQKVLGSIPSGNTTIEEFPNGEQRTGNSRKLYS